MKNAVEARLFLIGDTRLNHFQMRAKISQTVWQFIGVTDQDSRFKYRDDTLILLYAFYVLQFSISR
ncbi:MAG TPA: hypothetical protein DCL66_04835 [Gammaproteobacteria bacterium]|nr:hypothetical protein [Gammaproteobacteria bacterium]